MDAVALGAPERRADITIAKKACIVRFFADRRKNYLLERKLFMHKNVECIIL